MAYTLVNPYCTVAEVKAALKIGTLDTSKDDIIGKAIYDASRYLDAYTGRDYYQHDHTVTALVFDDESDISEDKLFTPYRPIISISEVESAGVVLVANTDYVVINNAKGESFIRSLKDNWCPYYPDNLIEVKGLFGYVQASSAAVPTGIPPTISWAAIQIAAAFSGYNKKECVGLDGVKTSVECCDIPASVFRLLGKKPFDSALLV